MASTTPTNSPWLHTRVAQSSQVCGLGPFYLSSNISSWARTQHPAYSHCLTSLCHPAHKHLDSDVQRSVRERRKRKTELPHLAWSGHPGINSYWLLFLSIAEKILFKWPWQWTLFCRELQEGSSLRAAAGACCSWGCESITKHLGSTCQSGL